jgi:hypothetical protein
VDFIKDDVSVGKLFLEEKLLNEDAVGHIDDGTLVVVKRLHSDMVPHCRAQLTSDLLRHPDS